MEGDYTPTEQAWFKRPLRTILLAAVLVGCGNTPTVGEFVDDWAASTCSRQVRCGWYDGGKLACEAEAREFLCRSYDCNESYEPPPEVLDCLASYALTPCSDPIPVCKFP